MDWATSTLAVPMTPLFWGMIRTPPEQRNPEAIEAERLKTEAIMQILDIPPGPVVGEAYQFLLDLRLDRGPMDASTAATAQQEVASMRAWTRRAESAVRPAAWR